MRAIHFFGTIAKIFLVHQTNVVAFKRVLECNFPVTNALVHRMCDHRTGPAGARLEQVPHISQVFPQRSATLLKANKDQRTACLNPHDLHPEFAFFKRTKRRSVGNLLGIARHSIVFPAMIGATNDIGVTAGSQFDARKSMGAHIHETVNRTFLLAQQKRAAEKFAGDERALFLEFMRRGYKLPAR